MASWVGGWVIGQFVGCVCACMHVFVRMGGILVDE